MTPPDVAPAQVPFHRPARGRVLDSIRAVFSEDFQRD